MATEQKRKRGRPPERWLSLAEVARQPLLAMVALPPMARPFFPSAQLGEDGLWRVPECEVADYFACRAQRLYTVEQVAVLLGVSRWAVHRRLVTRRPVGREIGAVKLGREFRVPDSELARITTPSWEGSSNG
jgi:excisionase family DNA binding protein